MNSYNNQYRRGPGRGECCMPEMAREKECHRMPEMTREKECHRMLEMAREKECHRMPENPKENHGCHMHENSKWPIGMTYVPMQVWRELYEPEEGFHQGTIFKELDLPFLGRRMH